MLRIPMQEAQMLHLEDGVAEAGVAVVVVVVAVEMIRLLFQQQVNLYPEEDALAVVIHLILQMLAQTVACRFCALSKFTYKFVIRNYNIMDIPKLFSLYNPVFLLNV